MDYTATPGTPTAKTTRDDDSVTSDTTYQSEHNVSNAVSEYQKQKNFAKVLDNLCKIGMDGMIVISDRGVILRVNGIVLSLLEYLQDELVNSKINKLLPKYHRSRHDGYLLRYNRTLCPVILNHERKGFHIVRKARYQGEPEELRSIAIALKVTEIVDANGQRYFVGVIKDERVWYKNEVHSKIVKQMFPDPIYNEVMKHKTNISGKDDCSVVFVDLVGFTSKCEAMKPSEIVMLLNRYFKIMDEAIGESARFIKTIGDCYMYVCGLECCTPNMIKYYDHPKKAIDIALRSLELLKQNGFELNVRIGICTGSAVFGVFGNKIPVFDVFGEVVNIASRMENLGTPGSVTVFNNVRNLTQNFFEFRERVVDIKGMKGKHNVYDVIGVKKRSDIFRIHQKVVA